MSILKNIPECIIKFNDAPGNTHISQILAGYKLLENKKLLKIKNVVPYAGFRTDGNYEHNSIVEVKICGKKIAYDMADGYQSIHRKERFDAQLESLDFYFKRSYDEDFHLQMQNRDKVSPLGLNYLCSCEGNPYDRFYFKDRSLGELKKFLLHTKNKSANKYDYRIFESNSIRYDEYNLLFLTRLWDSSQISTESILKTYPYFSVEEAKEEAEKWKSSLDSATQNRILYIRELKNYFGDKIIAGVSDDNLSRKLCPEFIVDPAITDRNNYLSMIKKNYICITSEGLHHSIGWKFAEYVAAGKAIVTEPLFYEVPYGFCEDKNYLTYTDIHSCISNCERLLGDTDAVHAMEFENKAYYESHVRPDMLVLDSLKIALPEIF